jgi:hypothetical protein
MLKSHKRQFVDSSDPFFLAVQREILRFLGRLHCRDDLNNPLTAEIVSKLGYHRALAAWSINFHLAHGLADSGHHRLQPRGASTST